MQRKKTTINYDGRLIDFSEPAVMGIINVTPDSFYPESRRSGERQIVERANQIIEEGGTIIDLGAYSSRPRAENITVDEELNRLLPAVETIKNRFPDAMLSIDTFRSEIVRRLFDRYGCIIVNDISAGEIDKNMIPTVGRLKLPYIAGHMRGTPADMHEKCGYDNVAADMVKYFSVKIHETRTAGINDLIIDPGFGFAKTIEENYELLYKLDYLNIVGLPITVGLSRKSMFYEPLNAGPDDVLPATTAAHTVALEKGADILRVHDVKAAYQTIEVFMRLKSKK